MLEEDEKNIKFKEPYNTNVLVLMRHYCELFTGHISLISEEKNKLLEQLIFITDVVHTKIQFSSHYGKNSHPNFENFGNEFNKTYLIPNMIGNLLEILFTEYNKNHLNQQYIIHLLNSLVGILKYMFRLNDNGYIEIFQIIFKNISKILEAKDILHAEICLEYLNGMLDFNLPSHETASSLFFTVKWEQIYDYFKQIQLHYMDIISQANKIELKEEKNNIHIYASFLRKMQILFIGCYHKVLVAKDIMKEHFKDIFIKFNNTDSCYLLMKIYKEEGYIDKLNDEDLKIHDELILYQFTMTYLYRIHYEKEFDQLSDLKLPIEDIALIKNKNKVALFLSVVFDLHCSNEGEILIDLLKLKVIQPHLDYMYNQLEITYYVIEEINFFIGKGWNLCSFRNFNYEEVMIEMNQFFIHSLEKILKQCLRSIESYKNILSTSLSTSNDTFQLVKIHQDIQYQGSMLIGLFKVMTQFRTISQKAYENDILLLNTLRDTIFSDIYFWMSKKTLQNNNFYAIYDTYKSVYNQERNRPHKVETFLNFFLNSEVALNLSKIPEIITKFQEIDPELEWINLFYEELIDKKKNNLLPYLRNMIRKIKDSEIKEIIILFYLMYKNETSEMILSDWEINSYKFNNKELTESPSKFKSILNLAFFYHTLIMTLTLKSKVMTNDKAQEILQILMKNIGKLIKLFAKNSPQFIKYRDELLNKIIIPPEDNNTLTLIGKNYEDSIRYVAFYIINKLSAEPNPNDYIDTVYLFYKDGILIAILSEIKNFLENHEQSKTLLAMISEMHTFLSKLSISPPSNSKNSLFKKYQCDRILISRKILDELSQFWKQINLKAIIEINNELINKLIKTITEITKTRISYSYFLKKNYIISKEVNSEENKDDLASDFAFLFGFEDEEAIKPITHPDESVSNECSLANSLSPTQLEVPGNDSNSKDSDQMIDLTHNKAIQIENNINIVVVIRELAETMLPYAISFSSLCSLKKSFDVYFEDISKDYWERLERDVQNTFNNLINTFLPEDYSDKLKKTDNYKQFFDNKEIEDKKNWLYCDEFRKKMRRIEQCKLYLMSILKDLNNDIFEFEYLLIESLAFENIFTTLLEEVIQDDTSQKGEKFEENTKNSMEAFKTLISWFSEAMKIFFQFIFTCELSDNINKHKDYELFITSLFNSIITFISLMKNFIDKYPNFNRKEACFSKLMKIYIPTILKLLFHIDHNKISCFIQKALYELLTTSVISQGDDHLMWPVIFLMIFKDSIPYLTKCEIDLKKMCDQIFVTKGPIQSAVAAKYLENMDSIISTPIEKYRKNLVELITAHFKVTSSDGEIKLSIHDQLSNYYLY